MGGNPDMSDNPILAPVKSPWGGFDVHILPDDDDAARAAGWPAPVIVLTQHGEVYRHGRDLYVRKTTWERVLAEFGQLGKLQ